MGVTGGAVEEESAGRFRKGLEKLMNKRSVEGLFSKRTSQGGPRCNPSSGCWGVFGEWAAETARLMCSLKEGSLIATLDSRVLGELDQSDPGQQVL